MSVYAALTDGRGRIPITIRLIDVDDQLPPIWADTQDVDFSNPRRVKEIAIEILDTPFKHTAFFAFSSWHGML